MNVAGVPVSNAILLTAAVSAGAAALATLVLRYEVEMPLWLCTLVIPPVTGLGMGLAVALQLLVGLTLAETWGLLGGTLVALVVAYEGLTRLTSDPRPPRARYN